jgi:outer membrane autotransporter protein
VKRGNLYVSGNVSWMHEFLDADCDMTSKWAVSNNPSTFGVSGHSLGRNWAVIGAGMDWQLRQNLSVFGSYNLQANGNHMLNIGTAGARIQW